jgi:hypothetical protein
MAAASDDLLIQPSATAANHHGNTDMQRMKNPEPGPTPRPGSSLLVGAVIGSAIMTMATQAMLVGATVAMSHVTLRRG